MSICSSPRVRRNVLFADAASCLVTGALQLLFTAALADLLHLPGSLLAATGLFLVAYGALVAYVATRDPLPRALVWLFVAGNAGWAVACAVLLAGRVFQPTLLGEVWVLAQAATVLVLAELQWTGLRRQVVPGWA
jgi:hypothetical protein